MGAKFEICISPENRVHRKLRVLAVLEDKDGKIYRSKPYAEMAYEGDFEVFKPTFSKRLKSFFNKVD